MTEKKNESKILIQEKNNNKNRKQMAGTIHAPDEGKSGTRNIHAAHRETRSLVNTVSVHTPCARTRSTADDNSSSATPLVPSPGSVDSASANAVCVAATSAPPMTLPFAAAATGPAGSATGSVSATAHCCVSQVPLSEHGGMEVFWRLLALSFHLASQPRLEESQFASP